MKTSQQVSDVHRLMFGQRKAEIAITDAVMSVRFSPDGKYVAAATSGGPVYYFPATATNGVYNPLEMALLSADEAETGATTSQRFGGALGAPPDYAYNVVTTTSLGKVSTWSVLPGSRYTTTSSVTEEGNELMVADFSPNAAQVVTGGSDQVVRLYDRDEEGELKLATSYTQQLDSHGRDSLGHNSKIMGIKWVTPHTFLSAGWESSVLLFDARVGRAAQRQLPGPRIGGDGMDVVDGVVVTASERSSEQLQAFDLGSGRLMHTVSVEPLLVCCKAFGRRGKLGAWVAGREGNSVMCIDVASGKRMAEVTDLPASVFALDVHPTDPQCVVAGGAGNALYRIKADIFAEE
jgi:hypothetical protein